MASAIFFPTNLDLQSSSQQQNPISSSVHRARRTSLTNKTYRSSVFPVARLFGPAIFEAAKLKVLFLGVDHNNNKLQDPAGKLLPRTYTLTHSDITAKLTLAISQTINNTQLQSWSNRFYRDEVVAEWKIIRGKMSLHVHCHISGGHFLLDLFARLRFYIFYKELPVVLKAFIHGDDHLFKNYPELQDGLVWVYFHSSLPEFNKVQCWGPLKEAGSPKNKQLIMLDTHKPCQESCTCCFPPGSLIPWVQVLEKETNRVISLAIETNQNVNSTES